MLGVACISGVDKPKVDKPKPVRVADNRTREVRERQTPNVWTAEAKESVDPMRYVSDAAPGDSSLPHVHCPTMGIWSTDDPFLGQTQMTASVQFVDAPWRYERVDGVDHWLPVRAPDTVTELLLDFLTG